MNNLVKAAICVATGAIVATAIYVKIRKEPAVEVVVVSNSDIEDLISEAYILTLSDMEDAVELLSMYYINEGVEVPTYALREAVIDRFEECTGLDIVSYMGCESTVNSWISGVNNAA
tara:strand:+ start:84 stop:434 length:351 start_codon:yes stop_codon:yes gene_type:complete